jgi:hypothetical protein
MAEESGTVELILVNEMQNVPFGLNGKKEAENRPWLLSRKADGERIEGKRAQ